MVDKSDLGVAKAWIALQYAEQKSEAHASNFWAYTMLDDLLDSDAERSWEVIQRIQDEDSSDFVLSNLAAGPIEDLLAKCGERFIDRVEICARSSDRFRFMLGMVWKNNIPEPIWARIQKALAA